MKKLIREALFELQANYKNIISPILLKELNNCGQRARLLPPLLILQGIIFQALSPTHSYRDAVIHLFTTFSLKGSLKTSSFSRARSRIPNEILERIAKWIGHKISKKSTPGKRRFLWIDGSLLQMATSSENDKNYPHSTSQQKGLGIPLIRALCVFCANTGSFLDLEFGLYRGIGEGEPNLLRKMLNRFKKFDVLIMDRYFSGFDLMETMLKKKLDFVIRMRDIKAINIMKSYNFKREKTIELRSSNCILKCNQSKKIKIRIVKSIIERKGFRSRVVYIITSLLKEKARIIKDLYGKRWGIEIAFRNIKKTMGLSFIRSKTPESVKKQIWSAMIAYNLIIFVMAKAIKTISSNKTISFKTTAAILIQLKVKIHLCSLIKILRMLLSCKFDSPYRREPRAIKNRTMKYPFLTVPRNESHKQKWGYARRRSFSNA